MRRGPPSPHSPPSRPDGEMKGGDEGTAAAKTQVFLPELISCVSWNVEHKSDMSIIPEGVARPWQALFLQEVGGEIKRDCHIVVQSEARSGGKANGVAVVLHARLATVVVAWGRSPTAPGQLFVGRKATSLS